MNTKTSPFKISIASPCPARWEDMGGDHRIRFCDHCRKNVYNLSALTPAEAAALLESKQGHLCARIYQRADGTVLTDDCPVGMARQWRRLKFLVGSGVAVILLTLVNLSALGREDEGASQNNRPRSRFVVASENVMSKLTEWLDLSPKHTMGKIRVTPTMGQIAVPAPVTPTPVKK